MWQEMAYPRPKNAKTAERPRFLKSEIHYLIHLKNTRQKARRNHWQTRIAGMIMRIEIFCMDEL